MATTSSNSHLIKEILFYKDNIRQHGDLLTEVPSEDELSLVPKRDLMRLRLELAAGYRALRKLDVNDQQVALVDPTPVGVWSLLASRLVWAVLESALSAKAKRGTSW